MNDVDFMRIGLEISSLAGDRPTGIGRYIENLLRTACQNFSHENNFSLFYKLSKLKKQPVGTANTGKRYYYKSYWPFIRNIDLLHGLDGYVPAWNHIRTVVTIHDLAAIKLNDRCISTHKFRSKKEKTYRELATRVDGIITVSNSTRNDIMEILNYPCRKIHVTHLGVDSGIYSERPPGELRPVLQKYRIKRAYVLFVGSISGRKNTQRMVYAFARSKAARHVDFVLAGGISFMGEKTLAAISEAGLADRVTVLNYVDERDLPALYTGAAGFVFPTLYEGFGLPILEAMACGTPVLTANTGAAPEIGGGHALHVNPYDIDEIAAGIDALLEFPAERIKQGIRHAREFTWDRCAEKTMAVYKHIMAG